MKILTVEDDNMIREGISEYLSEFGYTVIQAKDGREAFKYKDLSVNFNSYTAKINGEEIDVNAKELEVLKCLLDNNGRVLTRMQIIDYVWKDSEEIPYDRVIDVYIKELRKKLQLDCITTIRNVGYKLERK